MGFPEDVRMAANKLVVYAFEHIRHAELAIFTRDLGIQLNLKRQVGNSSVILAGSAGISSAARAS